VAERTTGEVAAVAQLAVAPDATLLYCFARALLHRAQFGPVNCTQANPPRWVDTPVGNPSATAAGLYKTWPDPTEGNRAPRS
jgi:hypothetical protein